MSTLADQRDLDCVSSLNPLVFDVTAREVVGADAVLRRILYRWCSPRGSYLHASTVGVSPPIPDLEGMTLSPAQISIYKSMLLREALDEDFVLDASVQMAIVDGVAQITAQIKLVDGKTYALAVSASAAGAAITALGGTS